QDCIASQEHLDAQPSNKQVDIPSDEEECEEEAEHIGHIPILVDDPIRDNSSPCTVPPGDGEDQVMRAGGSPFDSGTQVSGTIRKSVDGPGRADGDGEPVGKVPTPIRSNRTKSCPPGTNRFIISGPWSMDWLHDHNQGDAGVIFSARTTPKKDTSKGEGQKKVER
ncbi:hypothetical protein A2U01_0050504, partial [Trifolium medium]|nr:hypothetical protein [Trifolium medium]